MSKQEERLLELTTPLGGDELLLRGFYGQEDLSRLFSFELELLSLTKTSIAPTEIVGKSMSIGVHRPDGTRRYFNGLVSQFYAGNEDSGRREYRARLVPWLWFLTRRSDCRIFQNQTVQEIVEEVFEKLGFTDFDSSGITGEHPKREYCVQYRETDYNFVARLLEEEGIFYFFKHEKGKHTLVLGDKVGGYFPCDESQVDFPSSGGSEAFQDHLTAWEHRYEFRTGKWAQTDYNFETPQTSLLSSVNTVIPLSEASKFEFFDFPGPFLDTGGGQQLVKWRMEEEEVGYDVVHASSLCRSFGPGGKFKVGKHRSDSEKGKEYVITSIQHVVRETQPYLTGEVSPGGGYSNSFTCIPSSTIFRPARLTPKPVVQGVQTAVVVGPQGEEIYCDKYGRVKVQFHWDRYGKSDEKSSCWIRVAGNAAGRRWGFVAIPRIGQEVVVECLEGDPDNPLIVGSVYNADQMPHYTLPDDFSRTYIKTNSTKGGSGFNELMFEDKKDDELVFVHAERDMDVRVKNDSHENILGDRHQTIGSGSQGTQREFVHKDKHVHIGGNQDEQIEGDLRLLVGSKSGNLDLVVTGNNHELVEKEKHLHVKGNQNEKVDGTASLTVGADQFLKVTNNFAVDAGMAIHIKAGMSVVIEAGADVTLKGPGGFVSISPAGVSIQGTTVLINSGGAPGVGLGSNPLPPIDAVKANPEKPDDGYDSETGMKSSS